MSRFLLATLTALSALLVVPLLAGCAGDGGNLVLTEEMGETIEYGMTYEDVVEIIGAEANLVSDIQTFAWPDLGIEVNFNDEGSGGKSRTGESKELYESIDDGMTYDQVVEIFGSEGTLVSESTKRHWDGTGYSVIVLGFSADGTYNGSLMSAGLKSDDEQPTETQ